MSEREEIHLRVFLGPETWATKREFLTAVDAELAQVRSDLLRMRSERLEKASAGNA